MSERADLVFEGGGVKGIGLAGAFHALYDRGYRPECVAGTSAGAITASLVAAGYSGDELAKLVLKEMHFQDFEDRPPLHRLGALGDVLEVLRHRGIHPGDYFLAWIAARLSEKGVHTFADLRSEGETPGSARAHRLQVIASDLTSQSMLVLPRDASAIGFEPDELPVALAVRMSMAIPLFFRPVLRPGGDKREHMIVDGGMLSNYPVWLFDTDNPAGPSYPTFGLLLVAPDQEDPLLPNPPAVRRKRGGMPSLLGYAKAVVETMLEAHDRLYVEEEHFVRTIAIPTCGVATTDFEISPEKTKELFESGRSAAETFLASWNFERYKQRYRRGPAPGRRERVAGSA